jgi:putative copper export protein
MANVSRDDHFERVFMVHVASLTTTVRLSLHVIAACVWLGGQITMGALVPAARTISPEAPRTLAKAFGRLSWPAFWILIFTGFWNYAAVHGDVVSSTWNTVFGVKMLCVLLAGVASAVHVKAPSARLRGASAGIALVSTIAALALGVALAG